MSRKWGTRLTVLAASLGLAGFGLAAAGASTAMATPTPGTTGQGSWYFLTFDTSWHATNGIQTTGGGSPTTQYQAQVKQPINAPGQIPSVFSNKTRTIPVKYVVQSQTCTPGSTTIYPGTLKSFAASENPNLISTNLYWAAPTGLTVSQITNLTANYAWAQGADHGGSMRWQIDTTNGDTLYIYYGDPTGFVSDPGYSGVNMIQLATDARAEQQGGSPMYDTWANILARPSVYGTIANEPVGSIGLIVDGGWGGYQEVGLTDASIVTNAGTSTYTPGTVSTDPSCTGWVADNSASAYLYLAMLSNNAPPAPIDETLITNTQGDFGGQFRAVDGMYMYNLPMSQLDPTAKYEVGIRVGSATADPRPTPVQFGLK